LVHFNGAPLHQCVNTVTFGFGTQALPGTAAVPPFVRPVGAVNQCVRL
jgi:hypothetical protein